MTIIIVQRTRRPARNLELYTRILNRLINAKIPTRVATQAALDFSTAPSGWN